MAMTLSDPPVPALLGRYRPQSLVGRGGMATVFRARDEILDREVAIKVFNSGTQDDMTQHRVELGALARLSHHGVISLIDAGIDYSAKDDPRPFLVMELVTGKDVKSELALREFSTREISEIAYDVSEALEYVHAQGVVHRDIKPSNIMLVQYGTSNTRMRARITDFGIALDEKHPQPDDKETTTGTAAYLSPEQATLKAATSASDIYSLGLVLLECFTRTVAFPGGQVETAMARLKSDPPIPESLPGAWAGILRRMTARNPADRPTADELTPLFRTAVIEASLKTPVLAELSPANEYERMRAVRRYDILDTPPDGAFDRITALAARVTNSPIAIVSVVDHDRIWFKSHHGLDIDEIDRDPGLCASAILQDEPWIIEDARVDPRALTNPLVAGDFGLQFYAGVPLRTADGFNVGTLCVLDFEPRPVTPDELASLKDLAAVVVDELELRLSSRRIASPLLAG